MSPQCHSERSRGISGICDAIPPLMATPFGLNDIEPDARTGRA
ncbi:MAG: hypothetical protein ACK4VI_07965 [Alphaproteobacteria bacterium]